MAAALDGQVEGECHGQGRRKDQLRGRAGELRNIEPAAFATLGNDVVAYLRPALAEGKPGWAVHAADGRVLAVIQGSREVALAIVRQNDLEPLSLH